MPAEATYEPIATTTLSSNTATVTLSNIPNTYTDLIIVATLRGSNDTESDIWITINSDNGSNYSSTRMYAQSSSTGTDRGTNSTSINIGRQGGTVFAPNIIQFFNYANTNVYKSILARSGHATSGAPISLANVGLWRSTAAITSISFIQLGAQSYKTGSTFTLYGIKAA